MGRSNTRPASEAAAPDTAERAVVHAPLREHPFIVAALALSSAMLAVAKFPNTPIPESLIGRLDTAHKALNVAADDIDQGFFTPEMTQLIGEPLPAAEPYDDAWIKERFDSLDAALKERFEADAKAGQAREDAAADAIKALRDDIEADRQSRAEGEAAAAEALAAQFERIGQAIAELKASPAAAPAATDPA